MTRCKNAFSVGGELYCCVKFDQNSSPLFCHKCDEFVARPEPSNSELEELLNRVKENKRLNDEQWEMLAKALDELLTLRREEP